MTVDEFNTVIQKVKNFKFKLEREGIAEETQQVILKVYIQDLTSRINVKYLKVV